MNQKPLVSIVVATLNSSRYLEIVLKSIKNQTYKKVEIIVVDNNSIDNTKDIAKNYTRKIYNKGPERCSQRNFGANKAKGELILFLDSDAELTKNVISECVKLSSQKCDMVIIPERHIGSGFWAKAKALERECFLGDDTVEAPWFLKKRSFLLIGGYDENLYAGEDWDLFERMKKRKFQYSRSKSFINHHLGQISFLAMVNKKCYYGKNLLIYINKNKKDFLKKIPLFRKAYFINWRLLVKHPFLAAGFIILKTGEVFFTYLGILNYMFVKLRKE